MQKMLKIVNVTVKKKIENNWKKIEKNEKKMEK